MRIPDKLVKPELPKGFWSLACPGKPRGCTGMPHSYGDTKGEAIAAWNCRSHGVLEEVIGWRSSGKPDELETVLVQTAEHEIDAAFVEAGEWRWLSSALIDSEVIYWTPMPDGIMTRARKESEKP